MAVNSSGNEENSKAKKRDRSPDQTVDSVDLSAELNQPVDGASGTVDSIDTSGLIPAADGGPEGAVPGSMQTMDSVDLSEGAVSGDVSSGGNANRTVDSVDMAAEGTEPKPKTAATVDLSNQTVELPTSETPGGTIEASSEGYGQTVDSVDSIQVDAARPQTDPLTTLDSAEVDEQMGAMWGDGLDKSKPMQTIKGRSSVEITGDSTLVVQERAFRPLQDDAIPQARSEADYDLLNQLGEGGMGVVYSARQASIDRTVAIKMLKSETAQNEHQRHKFLSEAVITGDLDHPNIVPIYDLGTNHEGALFYSMKCVNGTPWDERIGGLSVHENIEVLMKVADAVAFAHARNVIHRDLKPENVMLGDFGEVLVMDWGLAMPTSGFQKTHNLTATYSMGGTPAYMAPEMAVGPLKRIGIASDVYLLGAILYESVTGRPPHPGGDVMVCLRAAAQNTIAPTDKKGELVDIATKAMATDPKDRHASVQEFQAAIRSYLSHSESISLVTRAEEQLTSAEQTKDYQDYARSVFAFQEAIHLWEANDRARTGLRKAELSYAKTAYGKGDYDLSASLLDKELPEHATLLEEIREALQEREARQRRLKTAKRAVVGLVALILLVVTVAFLAVNHQRSIAVTERDRAETARQVAVAAKEKEEKARQDAERAREKEEQAKEEALAAEEKERLAKEEERKAKESETAAKDLAIQAQKEEEKARKAAELAREEEAKAKAEAEYQAYIALIGLAAAKIDENSFDAARELLGQCKKHLCNWEWGRLAFLCQQEVRLLKSTTPIEAIALDTDGRRLATGGWNGLVNIWDPQVDQPLLAIPHEPTSFVNAVAFSPDGRLIATGSSDAAGGYLRTWDAETGQLVKRFDGHEDTVLSVAFSPDGQWLLSSSFDETARLWNVQTGELVRTFAGHDWWVWSAAFSPDAKRIVTASHDGTAMVWDVDTGEVVGVPFLGHRRGGSQTPVYAAVFSPDGRRVASGGLDNRILIWDPDSLEPFDYAGAIAGATIPPQPAVSLAGHKAAVRCIRFSQDGGRILTGSQDNTVVVWDAETGESIKVLRGHNGWVRACVFSRDGKLAVSGSHDGSVKFWEIEGYEEARVLRGQVLDSHVDAVLSASFSGDGRQVATASRDRTAKTWDVETGNELRQFREGHEFTAATAIFFPDAKRLLTTAVDNTTRIWDVATGAESVALRLHGTGLQGAAAISHDGRWILTGSQRPDSDGEEAWAAKLWNGNDGKLVHELKGHKTEVTTVAFSIDDRLVLTGDRNGRCVLWDRETGEEKARFWDDDQINAAVFLPDGKTLLTASNYKAVRRWDISTGEMVKDWSLSHPEAVASMAVSGDGRWVLTGCGDGNVRLWDAEKAQVSQTLKTTGGKASFAQNLRRYMKEFNWTERQVAQQSQLSESLISDLLAAKLDAPAAAAEKLATVFEIQPSMLSKTVFSVAISPDGKIGLTIDSDDRVVRLWNLADGSELRYPVDADHLGPFLDLGGGVLRGLVWSADFSPDGRQVVTVGGDSARLWDLRKAVPARRRELINFSPHGAVASAQFSPDGKQLITGSWDNSARIWDAATGQMVRKLGRELDHPQDEHRGKVNSVAYSPDGRMVLTASDDGTVKLWSTDDWRLLKTLQGHEGGVLHAVFSHDSSRVLTSSRDTTARLWNAETGEQILVLEGHDWAVLHSAFSANGQWIVTGSEDNTSIVWRLTEGKATVVHTLKGHTASVTSVAFSHEEAPARILTGSGDYTTILWDAATGQEILTLKGHTQEVTSASFSPDGQYALTSSRDGTAIIWLTTDWTEPDAQLAAGDVEH